MIQYMRGGRPKKKDPLDQLIKIRCTAKTKAAFLEIGSELARIAIEEEAEKLQPNKDHNQRRLTC